MTQEHTPTPWIVEGCTVEAWRSSKPEETPEVIMGFEVASESLRQSELDAAFIVRAVNAHDDLVKACEEVLENIAHAVSRGYTAEEMQGMYGYTRARAALAKARG